MVTPHRYRQLATVGPGSFDAATRALNQVVGFWKSKLPSAPQAPRRPSRQQWAPQNLVDWAGLTLWDIRLLRAVKAARQKTQQFARRMDQTTFDGEEGLVRLKEIASQCGSLVKLLDGFYKEHRRLGQRWRLSPLKLPINRMVVDQLDTLICDVEDIGETAALSASPEFRARIMSQLAAHGIIPSEDL